MKLEDILLKSANPQRTNTVQFQLYEVPRVVKLLETEIEMAAARGRGRECAVII